MTISKPLNLFKPIQVGKITLNQRIAMAPMTRARADNPSTVPNDLMSEYYEQRASSSGTLLITEATFISERAGGYPNIPGIWSKDQVRHWKEVTDKVHAKGSFIFLQLWALGRSAGAGFLEKRGHPFVSASNLPDPTNIGKALSHETESKAPRPLTIEEINEYVQDFVVAAQNAVEAGFDGVEIHSANGYLLDQFLHEDSNVRTDAYGGSIENRARFTLQVVDAVSSAIGADKTAIRLSPYETYGGMVAGTNTIPQFSYVIEQLEKRALKGSRLAYIHLVETEVKAQDYQGNQIALHPIDFARYIWSGVWIRTQGFVRETAIEYTNNDNNLIIGFGKAFLANPDLVERIKQELPLTKFDYKTFYVPGPKGYIDYPFYDKE